jgi:hypothetical protein
MAEFVAPSMKLITRSPQKLSPSALPQTLLTVSGICELTVIVIDCVAGRITFTKFFERIVSVFGKG